MHEKGGRNIRQWYVWNIIYWWKLVNCSDIDPILQKIATPWSHISWNPSFQKSRNLDFQESASMKRYHKYINVWFCNKSRHWLMSSHMTWKCKFKVIFKWFHFLKATFVIHIFLQYLPFRLKSKWKQWRFFLKLLYDVGSFPDNWKNFQTLHHQLHLSPPCCSKTLMCIL